MEDENKTKKQLIVALNHLRQGLQNLRNWGPSHGEWRRIQR
jgi:hypothetical protein